MRICRSTRKSWAGANCLVLDEASLQCSEEKIFGYLKFGIGLLSKAPSGVWGAWNELRPLLPILKFRKGKKEILGRLEGFFDQFVLDLKTS